MELKEAMQKRRSVRQYKEIPLEPELITALQEEIDRINREADLHFQLITDEPKAFDSLLAHYGRFSGVTNYIALVGKKRKNLDEVIGYYGERLVLYATQLGLHTCWVAATYRKIPDAFTVEQGEKFTVVISIGHGRNRGLRRRSKTPEQVSNISDAAPTWFRDGVEAALLAPTAINQQQFKLIYHDNNTVTAKAGLGFYTAMDLGIVKYHFELGAGKENFSWT